MLVLPFPLLLLLLLLPPETQLVDTAITLSLLQTGQRLAEASLSVSPSLVAAFDWKSCCSSLFLFPFLLPLPLPFPLLGAHVCAIKGVVMCALIIIIR